MPVRYGVRFGLGLSSGRMPSSAPCAKGHGDSLLAADADKLPSWSFLECVQALCAAMHAAPRARGRCCIVGSRLFADFAPHTGSSSFSISYQTMLPTIHLDHTVLDPTPFINTPSTLIMDMGLPYHRGQGLIRVPFPEGLAGLVAQVTAMATSLGPAPCICKDRCMAVHPCQTVWRSSSGLSRACLPEYMVCRSREGHPCLARARMAPTYLRRPHHKGPATMPILTLTRCSTTLPTRVSPCLQHHRLRETSRCSTSNRHHPRHYNNSSSSKREQVNNRSRRKHKPRRKLMPTLKPRLRRSTGSSNSNSRHDLGRRTLPDLVHKAGVGREQPLYQHPNAAALGQERMELPATPGLALAASQPRPRKVKRIKVHKLKQRRKLLLRMPQQIVCRRAPQLPQPMTSQCKRQRRSVSAKR